MLIDSHCHIDGEAFDADRDEVVNRAKAAGVVAMLNVGTGDPHSDDFRRAVAVAEKYDSVYASVGVHPHDAKLYDENAEQHLIDLASSEKVIAWGEIGLDYYYDHSPRDTQKEVFRRQIKIAKKLQLPIIVHSRDANYDTVNILTDEYDDADADKSIRVTPGIVHSRDANDDTVSILTEEYGDADADKSVRDPSPGIMHCFGGTPQMSEALMKIGFFISFAGNVTFKKADELREAARVVPLDRLLVETDCPFLTPVPHRGKRNEPAMVVHTAQFLSEFYDIPFERLAKQTTQNFLDLFGVHISSDANKVTN